MMLARYPSMVAVVVGLGFAHGTGAQAVAVPGEFFERQVRPILQEHCFKCHGDEPRKLKGGLWLKSRAGVLRGGELGQVVDLEHPEKSLLLRAIGYEDENLQMPPKGKLPAEQVQVLTQWVTGGLPWAGEQVEPPAELLAKEEPNTKTGREWWVYQPLERPVVPEIGALGGRAVSPHPNPLPERPSPKASSPKGRGGEGAGWIRNPIDAFVLAKLEEAGLSPNGPATKLELVRRVYHDLIGLPPTPAEVEAFIADESPDAYERLVDRLLQSPHYGERWGRHWLDLVRWAETNGYERDAAKPNAWKYRDYVIRAFNSDKPYDQFIREQLAGDDLEPLTEDSIIATGYYRLGIWDDEPADPLAARFDELDDIIATTGQVFLGMTINCARCHDHKVDPILQKDYYRMVAFFRDVYSYGGGNPQPLGRAASIKHTLTDLEELRRSPEERKRLANLAADKQVLVDQAAALENEVIKRMPADDQRASEAPAIRPHVIKKLDKYLTEAEKPQYEALKAEIEQIDKQLDVPKDLALSVNNSAVEPEPTHLLIRGSAHAPGEPVEPGFPAVLGFPEPVIPAPSADARSSGRRRVLADWIASPQNPLTARVMVNRLWHHHLGRGLVRTPNEFGGLGEKPTHPQLLDWLAAEFIDSGWRIKAMHKLIMLSNTYRMSSRDNAAALSKDPANDLFWRFDMRRLSAEEIRDSVLAVNGSLNPQLGGPSIYTEVPQAVLQGASMPNAAWGESTPDQQVRRSVYVFIKRSLIEPVLGTFDLADTDFSCPVRFATTVPTQALTMLNSDFFNKQAAIFADRLRKEAGEEAAAQVELALRLTLCREPKPEEVARGVQMMRDWQAADGATAEKALEYFCLMALNLNEFVYLD